MDEDTKQLHDLLEGGVSSGDFIGYDCLIAHNDDVVLHLRGGFSQLVPERKPMHPKPIFDMASVTKPVATATAAMVAIEKGKFGLNTEIGDIIPEATNLPGVRICDLMSHRSGLPDGIPLYKNARSRQDCINGLMRVKPTRPPNQAEVYSDLGYMMVGLAMEKVFKKSQKQISRDLVFEPLGMKETSFVPSIALRNRAVATELQADGLPLVGVVHDENARGMEGVAGHAGLFSTTDDLLKLSVMMIGEGKIKGKRLLSEETVELMTTNQNRTIGGNYGYGWVTKKSESMFGELCSGQSFGHTGFTGTCVAVDPVKHISSIFLTSAVHPKRKETSINPYRRAVFDLAIRIGSER
ncbi:MAG TPA: serine hydrolase domain-containing protein [Thermoproteota archaeon]|nr:serine hydrolase domain-containing protein [Thermoproteota archaeon]